MSDDEVLLSIPGNSPAARQLAGTLAICVQALQFAADSTDWLAQYCTASGAATPSHVQLAAARRMLARTALQLLSGASMIITEPADESAGVAATVRGWLPRQGRPAQHAHSG